jgi:tripartite ATP-independent transporter DctM subunit
MSPEILGLCMVGALFVAILLGFPIAFTLILLGLVVGYIGFGDVVFYLMTLQIFGAMRESVLAAVPLFLFMGYLLERAGLMDRLFNALRLLLAPVRGALYATTIMVATLFAAATGIVGASVSIIGLMAVPVMRAAGYDTRMSAGTITAGGTLGILIPPSVMLVVMGPVLRVSVVQLFAAAIMPGLLLAGLFLVYTMGRSFFNPKLGPPLPVEMRAKSLAPVVKEMLIGFIPPAILVLSTLGTIMFGLATPTEGSAMGAFGSLLMVIVSRKLNWELLKDAVFRTARTSTMILVLVAASNFFGSVFSRLGTPTYIAESLLTFDLPPTVFLLLVLLLIFLLGWPLEWVPIVVVILPIFLPLVKELGFDLIWFGTLVAVTLQTAWLSPPVALSAYFLKGVVPDWDLKDIYIGMIQFMVLQLVGVTLLIMFPQIVLWLPSVLFN